MRVGGLFSGMGGMELGLERAGMQIAWMCEIDPHCRAVLRKHWPKVPVYEDVRELRFGRGAVDVLCGGFPCQDISIANVAGEGIEGSRSGLWFYYASLIRTIRPRFAIVENVAALLGRGMGRVLGDLAERGYDAEWRVLRALDCGLPHIGERIWIVATPRGTRREGCFQYLGSLGFEAAPPAERRHAAIRARRELETHLHGLRGDDGLSVTMERRRIHGLGNAVTPQIPEAIGKAIMQAESMTPLAHNTGE